MGHTMRVDSSSSDDELLARDDLRVDSDDHPRRHSLHHIGVPSLANPHNHVVIYSDVGLWSTCQRGSLDSEE
jgi:hypothetical protein